MRNLVGFLISTLLHALLGLAAIFFLNLPNRAEQKISQSPVLEVELAPTTSLAQRATVKKASTSHERAKTRHLRGSAQKISAQLFKRYSFDGEPAGGSSTPANFENFGTDSSAVFGANDNWGYHQEVFTRIDSQLIFDSLLAQYGHFGSVFVEFSVDGTGYLLNRNIKVLTEDPILKVHVMRALRSALKSPFDRTDWSIDNREVRFQAKFEFLYESSQANFKKQKEFGKPALRFKRATLEKPIPNNLEEHLLSGGVGYDLFAVAERWQKYNKKKALKNNEFDPFAAYKKDPDYYL